MFVTTIIIGLLIFGVVVAASTRTFVVVRQQQEAVVETFGRYTGTLTPGLSLMWPTQRIVAHISRQQQQFSQKIEVKTKDNVFVHLPVHVQYVVTNSAKAFYQLRDPVEQIGAYALNSVRTKASSLPMSQLFEAQDEISHAVASTLKEKMEGFGYQIKAVLVDQPEPSEIVKRSFDSVLASQREREAAINLAEAMRIKIVAEATADREAKKLSGEGIAEMRSAVVAGLISNIDALKGQGLDPSAVVDVLTETLRLDALREIGRGGNLIIANMATTSGGGSAVNDRFDPAALASMAGAMRSLPSGKEGTAPAPPSPGTNPRT